MPLNTMQLIHYTLVFLLVCSPAFAGTVRTRDGKTLQGKVAFDTEKSLTVTPESGTAIQVEWSNVQHAAFVEKPASVRIDTTQSVQQINLGKVRTAGATLEKDGQFTLTGSGWGAWGAKDSGQFAYWPLEGDGQMIARVAPYQDPMIGAMAGVMFRASLEPNAAFAATLVYPTGEVRFNRRPMNTFVGGPDSRSNPAQPNWVRIARRGNTFTAYRSKDGHFWQVLSGQTVEMPAKAYVGLFVANGTNTQVSTATFDQVRLIPGTPSNSYFEGASGPSSGIIFVDGTILAGFPKSLTDGKVSLVRTHATDGRKLDWPHTDAERNAMEKLGTIFPQAAIARLRFSTEPPDLTHIVPPGSTGVLLTGGDFIDGDIVRHAYFNYLDIQSVVFGAKRFDVPREAISAILRETKPEKSAYEVRLQDGSIIQAKSIKLAANGVTVDSPLAGVIQFPMSELVSVEAQDTH